VGGYLAKDGTVEFYGRIRALATRESVVLDFGAGRAAWFEDDQCEYRRTLRLLKGSVLRVVGCDVDGAVMINRAVDSAIVVKPEEPLPLANGSIDLVIADYVFEHVEHPAQLAAELHRVLKPGGWICARTPTRWNYVALCARLVKNVSHARVLKYAQPERKPQDVFPTWYRLNARRQIRRAFSQGFDDHSYLYSNEPQYHFGIAAVYWLFRAVHWVTPTAFHGNLFIFLQKRCPRA
jgi:SAM-dependent methyltransferase